MIDGKDPQNSRNIFVSDSKAREVELAMWRRRATYDPMKAAAEGRKKQEEAKKAVQSSKLDRYVSISVSFTTNLQKTSPLFDGFVEKHNFILN